MPVSKENDELVRLDKWLWAARFYKTRALARSMIEGGKVHYNGQRAKPSKTVETGAMVKFRQGYDEREVEILAISAQRLSAPQAQTLYRETHASIEKREKNAEAHRLNALYAPHPETKPDKKQRRDLIRFKLGE